MRAFVTPSVCALFLLVTFGACGTPPRPDGGDDGTTDAGNGSGSGSNTDNCSADAKLVYVVDENNTLSQYDPTMRKFHDLGQLACPSSGTPFSMGIDRNATAWVLYSTGELFRVDTTTLNCTKTNWTSQQGIMQYGMGFSTTVAGGTEDALFICGGTGGPSSPTSKLAKLDVQSFSATPVGSVTGWPELTGTGNAELWGFFPDTSAPRMARLDKTTGAPQQTFQLPSLKGMPTAWAFAFYGGDYYVFLAKGLETSTTVYQISGTDGSVKATTAASGRKIVGAGVSTCAPVIIQ